MKKFISILIPILSIFLLVGGTYFYINYGSKNIKEEHSKYLALINDNHDFTAGLKGLESLTTEKAKETLKYINQEVEIASDLKNIDDQLKNTDIDFAKDLLEEAKKLDTNKVFDKAISYFNTNIENYNKAKNEIEELDETANNLDEQIEKIVNKYHFDYSNIRDTLLDLNNKNKAAHTRDGKKKNTNTKNKDDSNTKKTSSKPDTQIHPRIVGQQVPETYNTIRFTQEGSTSRNIIENELKGDIANFTNEQIDEAIARYNAKNNG